MFLFKVKEITFVMLKVLYFHADAPATVEKVQQACMVDPGQFVIN